MNSSSSNSNYGFRNSNESNHILGFNSPQLASGLGSNSVRPRLMKMRRQSSNNPRSTPVSGSRPSSNVDSGLGFNPFRTSSESVFSSSSSGNAPKHMFSFAAGNLGVSSGIVDDLGKLKIDSDKSYSNATGGNAAFQFKAVENEDKSGFSQSMADQPLKEVKKLNVADSGSSGGIGSMKNLQDENPFKGWFTNTFGSKPEAELQHEMHKLNLGNHGNVGVDSNNLKGFVFGRSEPTNHGKQGNEEGIRADVISDRVREMKLSGDKDDSLKKFVFGSNSMQNEEPMKADLISDRMRELKVGAGGEEFVFGQNAEPKVYEASTSCNLQAFGNAYFTSRSEKNVEFTFSSKLDNSRAPNVDFKTPNTKGCSFSSAKSVPEARLKKKKGKVRKPVISQLQPKQDFVFGQSSVQISESSEAYSPMDVSPYQETLADNYSRGTSVTSDGAASQINDQNSVSSESHLINTNMTTDEDLITATQQLNVNGDDLICEVSEAETFKSAMENLEFSSDTFATALDSELSSTATSGNQEKSGSRLFEFGSKLENISKENFTFAASTSGQSQMSPETRKHKKKHRLKTSPQSYSSTSDTINTYASTSSILSPRNTQKVDMSALSSKNKDTSKPVNDQESKHETLATASVRIAAEEVCEKWRLRC